MTSYQTVSRAGAVLDLFDSTRPEWGPTAVSSQLGIAKSQAHRLLASLADAGLLQRQPSGRYRLGWRLITLAHVLSSGDLMAAARWTMESLVERFGETVELMVWERGHAVCVDALEGTLHDHARVHEIGSPLPHRSCEARAILAFLPWPDAADALTAAGSSSEGATDADSIAVLRHELRRIRRRGFSAGRVGLDGRYCGVAAPFFDAAGSVVGVLGLSVPAARGKTRVEDSVEALVAAAGHLTDRLRASDANPPASAAARQRSAMRNVLDPLTPG